MDRKKIGGIVALVVLVAIFLWRQSERTTAATGVRNVPNVASTQLDSSESRASQAGLVAVNPLAAYRPTADATGSIALDELYARGVPRTKQTVELARQFLNGPSLNGEQKMRMMSILASVHDRDNSTGLNDDIAFELEAMTRDADRRVAGEAAINLARLGYRPGTEVILRDAYNRGVLSETDYGREIAHLVASAPPEKQKELIESAKALSDPLAAEILVSNLVGNKSNGTDYLKSSPEMAELLRSKEPSFGMPTGQYGGATAINYDEWLRASAVIENRKTGVSVDKIIVDKLSDPNIDPRKILAVLSSPAAEPLLASAPPESPVHDLIAKARQYVAQNENVNPFVASLMREIDQRTKTPRARTDSPPVFTPPTGPLPGPQLIPNAPHSMPR